jgi:hypothetical protein
MSPNDDPRFAEIRRALERAADASSLDLEPIHAALVEDDRRLRRMRVAASAAASLPVLAWLASFALHPVRPDVCPDFTRHDVWSLGVVPAAAWSVGAILVWRDAPWAQLLVRATWWSLHVTGLILTWTRPGLLPYGFPAAGLGGGAALLILGGRGIAPFELEGPLRPRRHTGEVVALSVLGGADLLTVVAADVANGWGHPVGTLLVAVLLPAVAGVMTLRRWAPHATILANLLFAMALTAPLAAGIPRTLAALLTVSALVQVVLAARILVSLARGLEADLPVRQPLQDGFFRGLVALGILAAAAGAVRPVPSSELAASCAESRGHPPSEAP